MPTFRTLLDPMWPLMVAARDAGIAASLAKAKANDTGSIEDYDAAADAYEVAAHRHRTVAQALRANADYAAALEAEDADRSRKP